MSTVQCDRSRSWISLRLDGSLSEFESAFLERHLARCPSCRRFAADAERFTQVLRDAPLVPVPAQVELEIASPDRRRGAVIALGAVAATVVAAVLALQPGPAQPQTAATLRPSGLALFAPQGDSLAVRTHASLGRTPDGTLVRGAFGLPA